MAALTSRITLKGDGPDDPEDFLSTSLGVIFPDDVTNQHGDAEHSLIYTSPYLPKPLLFDLADPEGETDLRLFSHYLWNASLLLAELVERDSLEAAAVAASKTTEGSLGEGVSFDVRGLTTLELGAGTALPSVMSGLLGAERVVVTDYPAPTVMKTLKTNVGRNITPDLAPEERKADVTSHAFDRMFVADCLWMPWQHANLRASIGHFLKDTPDARAWVVAGFHTGRPKMAGFFDAEALRTEGVSRWRGFGSRSVMGRRGSGM
ncbi:hypothetical protein PT974_04278 [Cladobotryum mycophilum]|uniref:Nicotinamide N-methyltransferase n=1 Tax=Cladobotryum mycophilum TaxID=491253 RepID=A0ABR0SUJ0_9HYPO